MRRLFAWILALMLVVCGCAHAQETYYAVDLALAMAEYLPDMVDVKEKPLQYVAQNRAIWYDMRLDVKCALIVYDDPVYAQEAVLLDSTRTTAVRAVDNCALYINRSLGADAMLDYQLILAELLGVQLDDSLPDYVLNESTGKFHYPDCDTLQYMKEENRYAYVGDAETLVYYGYEPCRLCNP